MRFTTTLDSAGKNAAGFRVPREVVEALGKGKRPPVVVTINGYSYRNTVAVYGDEFLIGVAQEHRGPARVTACCRTFRDDRPARRRGRASVH